MSCGRTAGSEAPTGRGSGCGAPPLQQTGRAGWTPSRQEPQWPRPRRRPSGGAERLPACHAPPPGHRVSPSGPLQALPAQARSPHRHAHVKVYSLSIWDLGWHQVGHEWPVGQKRRKLGNVPPAPAPWDHGCPEQRGPSPSCRGTAAMALAPHVRSHSRDTELCPRCPPPSSLCTHDVGSAGLSTRTEAQRHTRLTPRHLPTSPEACAVVPAPTHACRVAPGPVGPGLSFPARPQVYAGLD